MLNQFEIDGGIRKLQHLPNHYVVNKNLKWREEVKYYFEDGTQTPWLTPKTLAKYKDKIVNGPQIVKINSR